VSRPINARDHGRPGPGADPQKLRRPARLAKAAPGHGGPAVADPVVSQPPDAGPVDGGLSDTNDVEEERVVLSVGSTHFHNGRVSPERYASDLAPSFLGAIVASHTLLRELFKEMGAPEGASIQADCERWHLRYGSDVSQAQFSVDEQVSTNGAVRGSTAGNRAGADGWVRGLVASRDADHAQALAAFEAEAAEAAEAGAPQRAAIAYRAAGAAALAAGRGDQLVLSALAVVAGAAVIVGAPRLGVTFPILADLARHPGLLAACTVGYLFLGIGLFCSQLLFSLSAPMRPLAAAWAGLAALGATSIGAAWAGPTVSAIAGLVAGAGVYAAVAVMLAHRAFTRADLTYYRTL
jgi:hypothetical protein